MGLYIIILDTIASSVAVLLIPFFLLKFPVLQDNLDVYLGLQQFIVTTRTST